MPWAPDYATDTELSSYLRLGDTLDSVELGLAVASASRAVDRRCNRQFGVVTAAEERRYVADWNRRRGRWVVDVDDVMTETGMTVAVDAGLVDVFRLEPVNAAQKGRPWTELVIGKDSTAKPASTEEPEVVVTAVWGWDAVPGTVKQATLLQASRFFTRRDSPFGVAGSPDQGSELRLLERVDPDVAVMLADYVRMPPRVG